MSNTLRVLFAGAALLTPVFAADSPTPLAQGASPYLQQIVTSAKNLQTHAQAVIQTLKNKENGSDKLQPDVAEISKSAAELNAALSQLQGQSSSLQPAQQENVKQLSQMAALLSIFVKDESGYVSGTLEKNQRGALRANSVTVAKRAAMIEQVASSLK